MISVKQATGGEKMTYRLLRNNHLYGATRCLSLDPKMTEVLGTEQDRRGQAPVRRY